MGRDTCPAVAEPPDFERQKIHPEVALKDMLLALHEVLQRAEMFESHQVQLERLSTRERMSEILESLKNVRFVPFVTLFRLEEGRLGVVVTFLAVLELVKESLIEIVQGDEFGPIHVKARRATVEELSVDVAAF